LISYRQSI